MGSYGGYYKGEKKKRRKDERLRNISVAPTFVLPQIIGKGKKE